MKDSKIRWIGQIPDNWSVIKGKYFLMLLSRKPNPSDEVITCFRDGEVTLRSNRREDGFTMSDKEIGYQGIKTGDLVVHGMDGFAGAIGISDSDGKGSPVLLVMDSSEDKDFLVYQLRAYAKKDVFVALSTGIRVRSCDLNFNKLGNLEYLVPPLEEQKKIADFLDDKCAQIDEITKDLEKKISKLEQYKKVLIKDAVTKGIDGAKLVDSGIDWIGKIPEHWRLIPNKYLFVETTDKVGKHWASYDLLSLTTSGVKIKDINNIGGKMPDNYEKYLIIKKGQMIFCLFDLDMSAVFAGITTADGMITSAYNAYNATDLINTRFANYFFQFVFINRTYKLYSKNIRYTVTTDVFNSIKTAVPPLGEQKKIADFLDDKCGQIDEITKATREEIETLKQYKQSLIYEYVTGKKEVPNE